MAEGEVDSDEDTVKKLPSSEIDDDHDEETDDGDEESEEEEDEEEEDCDEDDGEDAKKEGDQEHDETKSVEIDHRLQANHAQHLHLQFNLSNDNNSTQQVQKRCDSPFGCAPPLGIAGTPIPSTEIAQADFITPRNTLPTHVVSPCNTGTAVNTPSTIVPDHAFSPCNALPLSPSASHAAPMGNVTPRDAVLGAVAVNAVSVSPMSTTYAPSLGSTSPSAASMDPIALPNQAPSVCHGPSPIVASSGEVSPGNLMPRGDTTPKAIANAPFLSRPVPLYTSPSKSPRPAAAAPSTCRPAHTQTSTPLPRRDPTNFDPAPHLARGSCEQSPRSPEWVADAQRLPELSDGGIVSPPDGESATKYWYVLDQQKWEQKDIKVRIDPYPFQRGALRTVHHMKDLSEPEGPAQYYVAKFYSDGSPRTEYFVDGRMQAKAASLARKWCQLGVGRKVAILEPVVIELHDREGQVLYLPSSRAKQIN